MLVNDGLLWREPNKPAVVPKLSGADVRDLNLVRVPLELQIVHLVAQRGDIPIAAAAAVWTIGQMTKAVPTDEFVKADLGFHQALVESVASPRLTRLYRSIRGEIHLSMVQSKTVLGPERIAREHGGILDALREHDEELAKKRMREHLEKACSLIAEKLDRAVDQTS